MGDVCPGRRLRARRLCPGGGGAASAIRAPRIPGGRAADAARRADDAHPSARGRGGDAALPATGRGARAPARPDDAGAPAGAPGPRVRRRRQRSGRHPPVAGRGVLALSLPGLRTRVLIVAAILAVAFGGLVVRLVHLQIVRHAGLTALAERQYSRTVALNAPRGP